MLYRIAKPNLTGYDLHRGDDVMRLDAELKARIPGCTGMSYSFADGSLTVEAPAGADLSAYGEAREVEGAGAGG